MKVQKKKGRLIKYLLLALLATTAAASGTLAKYASTYSGGTVLKVAGFAGGGVINFDVALEGMSPGEDPPRTVDFAVQNYEGDNVCDVRMNYEIQVETTGNLPLTFSLVGEKEQNDSDPASVLAGALDENLKAVGGALPPASAEAGGGKRRHSYQLVVNWPADRADGDYSQEIDMVTVTVTAVQANPTAGG